MLARLFASPIASARAFAQQGADSFEARLALARIEWVEERKRIVAATVGIAIAAVFGFAALIFVGMAVVVGFWDTPYRLAAAVVVSLLTLLTAAYGWMSARRALIAPMFSETRAELASDWRRITDSLGSHGHNDTERGASSRSESRRGEPPFSPSAAGEMTAAEAVLRERAVH